MSDATTRPAALSARIRSKAAPNSGSPAARTMSICTFNSRAAASRRFNCESVVGLVGLTRTATRRAVDITSTSNWSRFGLRSTFNEATPVILPAGWVRFSTKPSATGSPPISKTIGIEVVAALAASAAGAPPGATMTSTRRLTSSAASAVRRLCWPSAQRNSISTFRPST